MNILSAFAWTCALLVSAPMAYLAIEVACGLRPLRRSAPVQLHGRAVILVPAHNEEAGIGATIRSLRATVPAKWPILVVADNCDDRTAELARAAGAQVVERQDASARGKGYALAFGRDFLRADPPDAVIVVDADCQLTVGSAERLTARVLHTQEAAQATNLVVADEHASPLVQVSNFAMLVKNLVRARGLQRLGGGIPLFGTGMAFPWEVFAEAELATADLVEDMQLGLYLARRGVRVHLEEEARVTSAAASAQDNVAQRRRWEHGFLRTAARDALPLMWTGIRRRSAHLLALGAHLLVPPLALLFLVAFAVLAVLIPIAVFAELRQPALVLGSFTAGALIFTLAAWATAGRGALSARALICVPLYALWKIPIYIGLLKSRQDGWNRTRRENEPVSAAKGTRS